MKIIKNYDSFVNESKTNGFKITSIDESDIPKLLEIKYDFFAKSYNYNKKKHDNYSLGNTDWSISKKLINSDGEIIGGYFLRKTSIEKELLELFENISMKELNDEQWINNNLFFDVRPLYNKSGIEGVSLFVDKKYQSLGLGQLLIDGTMQDVNIDYMLGYAYHTLGNIKQWMKRRYLILDKENFNTDENYDYGYYMTLETKNIKLKITNFGLKYKSEHTELNFDPSRGFIF